MNYYAAADRLIQEVNRIGVRKFGELKGKDLDDLKAVMTVRELYEYLLKILRKKAYSVAFEAYVIMLMQCGKDGKTAHQMAEKTIDEGWIDEILHTTDPVTLYRFDTETERRADRLTEALAVLGTMAGTGVNSRGLEIDRAMRDWSRMVGWFAIWLTDEASIQAMRDAGIVRVRWNTVPDERRCHECREMDGRVFLIDELPPKPHRGCRCWGTPVLD